MQGNNPNNNLSNFTTPQSIVDPPSTLSTPTTSTTDTQSSFSNTGAAGISSTPVNDDSPTPFMPPAQPQQAPVIGNTTPELKTEADTVLSPPQNTSSPQDTNIDQVVTSSHVPKKYGGGKVIATIFGVFLIAGAVVAGVTLVQQRQLLEQEASSGSECQHATGQCVLLDDAENVGSFDAPGTIKYVDITDQDSTRFYPGEKDDGCYRVSISGNHISWAKYGPGPDCKDVSNVQIWYGSVEATMTPNPTSTPTVKPSGTTTLTPTVKPSGTTTLTPTTKATGTPTIPSQTSAQCSAVTAYDENWKELNVQTLSQLEGGDIIYLTVTGVSTFGSFDKARFTVNGVLRPETSSFKPGTTNVFYDEYEIPAGSTTFTVGAQVHHTDLGWF